LNEAETRAEHIDPAFNAAGGSLGGKSPDTPRRTMAHLIGVARGMEIRKETPP
jgi:hypothetical protein